MMQRLYAIADTAFLERRRLAVVEYVKLLLAEGVRLVQLRHKGHYSRAVFAEAERIAAMCREAEAQLVIDDRGDIARALGAGLHVGQDDLPPRDARRVVGGAMLGFSTHNAAQLAAGDGEPADYLAVGPVFATASKENPDPVLGVAEVARLRALTRKPLVAIGGITLENAGLVFAAGVDSVAVISDLVPEHGDVRGRIREWVRFSLQEGV